LRPAANSQPQARAGFARKFPSFFGFNGLFYGFLDGSFGQNYFHAVSDMNVLGINWASKLARQGGILRDNLEHFYQLRRG
jgi:hypothetical protein